MDIALALGGGGIKGIAHVGVIRCLSQAGFRIKAISGTSAGAIVGALTAAGHTPDDIIALIGNINQTRIFNRLPQDGPSLMGLAGITHALAGILDECTFQDLHIPFACVAVDINSAQEIILSKGQVLEAVLASSAVPGVFPSQPIGPFQLVDGGVLDPVPVGLARWLAPQLPVVAVVLSPEPAAWSDVPVIQIPRPAQIPIAIAEQISRLRIAKALNIFVESVDISSRLLTELRLEIDRPEVIIRPDVAEFGILDKFDPTLLVTRGEKAAQQSLDDIRRALGWSARLARRFRKVDSPVQLVPSKQLGGQG